MNPGLVEDVLCFDQSFQGVVIDSIEPTPDKKGIETMRQIYSLDSLDSGMTVEIIMAARLQSAGVMCLEIKMEKIFLESVGGTCHLPILMHLLWEVSMVKMTGRTDKEPLLFLIR